MSCDEDDDDDHVLLLSYKEFLIERHKKDIEALLLYNNVSSHFSVHVNGLELFDTDMNAGKMLLDNPKKFLPIFEDALLKACQSIRSSHASHDSMTLKENCHVRVSNLPICPELIRDSLPRCNDVGRFLAVSGTVIRTTLTKLLEYEKEYMCNKCRHIFSLSADFEAHYALPKPVACPSIDGCNSMKFTMMESSNSAKVACKDYQEIKIQEQVQKLAVGTIPRSMWVVLEDDIVDVCKPGDDVTIHGVVLERWKQTIVEAKCEIEIVLRANNVVVKNDQHMYNTVTEETRQEFDEFWENYKWSPLLGRNHILASFCPQVFGLYVIKLAVTLVLIGGVQRKDDTGTKVRGECHLLLVGDPGTGKSQFLKYASKLMPRSVLTTGIGSTSAGLTVTAVKDSGEWQLEAGALVLADGGICCIDEFNSIREKDRASIHEAMEQQTISIAKAGLVCKLNSRTTVLAATNPKGKYDRNQSVSVNIALASPLLSRFDVVMVMMDTHNEEWDSIVSSFVLRQNRANCRSATIKKNGLWPMDRLQSYFCLAKTCRPSLTQDSNRILRAYYQLQRSADSRNAARTTIRLLESVIRLAQAHARLMLRDEVVTQDAVVAVCVTEASMESAAVLGDALNPLHTAFPEDPDAEYLTQAEVVLTRLGLLDLVEKAQTADKLRREHRSTANNSTGIAENDSCASPGDDSYRERRADRDSLVKESQTSSCSDHSKRLHSNGINEWNDGDRIADVRSHSAPKRCRTEPDFFHSTASSSAASQISSSSQFMSDEESPVYETGQMDPTVLVPSQPSHDSGDLGSIFTADDDFDCLDDDFDVDFPASPPVVKQCHSDSPARLSATEDNSAASRLARFTFKSRDS